MRTAAALVCVVLAGALALLAVDVLRVPGRIAADDARYAGRPSASTSSGTR